MGGKRRFQVFIVLALACLILLGTPFRWEIMWRSDRGDVRRLKKWSSDLPLRFRSDGTFKILQDGMRRRAAVAARRCSDLNTTQFLRRIISAEKPDLVVFSGDNIFGPSAPDAAQSLLQALAPAMEAGIPWAAILGNHDQESTMTRAEVMPFLSRLDYSVSQVNPPGPIDGFGNYNLEVRGAADSESANTSVLNLYLLDSGDREMFNGSLTYGWIKESQLRWLHDTSRHLQGSSTVGGAPGLVFFHIPIPEVRALRGKEIVGEFQQKVSCSSANSGVLRMLISMGDVKAVLTGHDHLNDFCGEISSVWFCYGGGFGYHGYGKAGWPRRARVIQAELRRGGGGSWLGVERLRTWKRLDDGALTSIDDQLLWEEARR
ncbi:unnamed protein product [Spirodela intermedia]|uniref:Calcineurin-like phosphoesterase domain-containing protein n=1 Tax=Spirodela intermedia TaxID=51605 RepID=A0A7I8JJL0_SPIIN|nr:unnamed protein product [Spirodela intermedia]CAA6670356.1 unnamed protein product [Spirodela intermedia]